MSNPIQGTPIEIWDDLPGPISGSTSFGIYDNDTQFQIEGPSVAKFIARKLGYPINNIELTSGSMYTAFEEAISTYSSEIYFQKIKDNYLSMEGNSTSISFNDHVITPNLGSQIRIAEGYGSEAGSGGNVTYYTGSLQLLPGIQDYDLSEWASVSASLVPGDNIEIKRIFYEKPPAIVRWFDPMAGTGTGAQQMINSFGFGNASPAVNFLMMPLHYDIQQLQAIEFNDEIRRSGFSFELVNNKLRIFPIPGSPGEGSASYMNLFFHYIKKSERNDVIKNTAASGSLPAGSVITNPSNVPYTNIVYTTINAPSKQWIKLYAVEIAREILGWVRGKYSNGIPIPGDTTLLDGSLLIQNANDNKLKLIENLRLLLDETGRTRQLEKQQQESQNLNNQMAYVPIPIYIF